MIFSAPKKDRIENAMLGNDQEAMWFVESVCRDFPRNYLLLRDQQRDAHDEQGGIYRRLGVRQVGLPSYALYVLPQKKMVVYHLLSPITCNRCAYTLI